VRAMGAHRIDSPVGGLDAWVEERSVARVSFSITAQCVGGSRGQAVSPDKAASTRARTKWPLTPGCQGRPLLVDVRAREAWSSTLADGRERATWKLARPQPLAGRTDGRQVGGGRGVEAHHFWRHSMGPAVGAALAWPRPRHGRSARRFAICDSVLNICAVWPAFSPRPWAPNRRPIPLHVPLSSRRAFLHWPPRKAPHLSASAEGTLRADARAPGSDLSHDARPMCQ
jgi:hypothetical protein